MLRGYDRKIISLLIFKPSVIATYVEAVVLIVKVLSSEVCPREF
jgi:hypothetical protein